LAGFAAPAGGDRIVTRLRILIKTLSPLYAGAQKPYGSFLETHTQISGALLRGAVAGMTLPDCAAPELIHNHEACAVKDLCPFYYLLTGINFPACSVAEGNHPSEPPLRTMVTCKAAPGFASQSKSAEPKHGVFDTLLKHLVFNELCQHGAYPRELPPQRCGQRTNASFSCEAPLEPFGKRYVRETTGRYHPVPTLRLQRMTHVGINRRRESAEQGLLFSVQAIAGAISDGKTLSNASFAGIMTVPDSWGQERVNEFKRFLEGIKRLGGEQTYGLGRVEVTVREIEDESKDLPMRVEGFNERLTRVWHDYTADGKPPALDGTYFTVDLLTPALLHTSDGTPTVQLTADMLKQRAEMLGFSNLPSIAEVTYPEAAEKDCALMFTAPTIVSGWSAAWGLPKPTALAAVAGSVYVFRTQELGSWVEALAVLEANGLGDRCEEGFGAVRICDHFHQEVEPQ
jgi:CRISPR-associated protein Csx10